MLIKKTTAICCWTTLVNYFI